MLNPKKMIPNLAVAALALTGCGDSGGGGGSAGAGGGAGTGGGGGDIPSGPFVDWCDKSDECQIRNEFCGEDATKSLPAGCEDSLESYFSCVADLSCEDISAGQGADCLEEVDPSEFTRCLQS